MKTLNAAAVIEAIKNPVTEDSALLLELDYTPAPMSINQWAAQAVTSGEDVSLYHFELVSGVYADLGVTTGEFDAVVAQVKAII